MTMSLTERLETAKGLLRKEPQTSAVIAMEILGAEVSTDFRVEALLTAARAHLHMGTMVEGERFAREALAMARDSGLRRLEALAHNETGVFRFVNADYDAAAGHYATAEALLLELDDDHALARVLVNTGNVFHRRAEYLRALTYYERALEIIERIGDILLEAKALTNVSALYVNVLNDVESSFAYTRRALVIYEQLGDNVGMAKAYANISTYYREKGEFDTAIAYARKSLALRTNFTETEELFSTYYQLIRNLIAKEDLEAASSALAEAMHHPLYRDAEYHYGHDYIDLAHAHLLIEYGQSLEALKYCDRVISLHNDKGDRERFNEALHLRSICLHNVGRHDEAYEALSTVHRKRLSSLQENSEARLLHLRALYDVAQAESDAEIERIRNVELADSLTRLERLHAENTEYLAFMAHELKSPLNTIRAISELLVVDPGLSSEDRRAYSGEIRMLASRMFDLVNGVLDRSKGRLEEESTVIDAGLVWRHVLNSLEIRAREKNIALAVNVAESVIPVRATERMLVSILENLVTNAVKFSPDGTTVSVDVKILDRDANALNPKVLLQVGDQGPGLSTDDMARLFAPFRRLSANPTRGEDSSGLGLHIVRSDVERLGGRIWCESISGEGSTFLVELPISELEGMSENGESSTVAA